MWVPLFLLSSLLLHSVSAATPTSIPDFNQKCGDPDTIFNNQADLDGIFKRVRECAMPSLEPGNPPKVQQAAMVYLMKAEKIYKEQLKSIFGNFG